MAIARVQTATVACSAASSATTGSITVGSGNLLIADVMTSDASGLGTTPAVSDSRSQTWTNAIPKDAGSNSSRCEEDYVASAAAGGTTFTITMAGTNTGRLVITEVSGAAASPLDKTSTLTELATGAHTCTATATTAQADELWHGCGCDIIANAFHTWTIGGSFVQGVNVSDSGGVQGAITGDYVVSSTGAAAFQYSDAGGTDYNLIFTSTWKAAAGGGSTNTLTVVVGNLGLAGKTDAMASAMPVVVGSLTLSGQTVLKSIGQQFTSVVGNLTLSSQASQMVAGYTVSKADLLLTGSTISFSVGKQVILVVGALALAGQTLAKTDSFGGAVGALTLAGQVLSLSTGSNAYTLPVGALTLAGYAVSFAVIAPWTAIAPASGVWSPVSANSVIWTPVG